MYSIGPPSLNIQHQLSLPKYLASALPKSRWILKEKKQRKGEQYQDIIEYLLKVNFYLTWIPSLMLMGDEQPCQACADKGSEDPHRRERNFDYSLLAYYSVCVICNSVYLNVFCVLFDESFLLSAASTLNFNQNFVI